MPRSASMSYHFSDEQHAFPGGGELFARQDRQQDTLARLSRVGSLDVPHGRHDNTRTFNSPPEVCEVCKKLCGSNEKTGGRKDNAHTHTRTHKKRGCEASGPRWKRKRSQRGNAAPKRRNICCCSSPDVKRDAPRSPPPCTPQIPHAVSDSPRTKKSMRYLRVLRS